MNKIRQQILKWQEHGHIDDKDIQQALAITAANNTPAKWYEFIHKSILWLSILSIAFGVIFFFAYNWSSISTFYKFALIQGLILISIFIYTQTQAKSHANIAILFFLALLIGSLFALFGQTYQTGKDPWQLFLLWTLFVTPLAVVARSSSLWLLWLALANLTLTLVAETRMSLFGMLLYNELNILLHALLNLLVAICFEFFYYSRYKLLHNRLAAQVAIAASMFAFTWVAIYGNIFKFSIQQSLDLLFYLIWMASVFYYYRKKTIDVLILSSWVISGIVFIASTIARVIDDNLDEATFLLLGLITIGLSTIGGKWLLKLLPKSRYRKYDASTSP